MLEIGTGSGYLSACLARLGGRVRSLELHAEIADLARANLQRRGAPSLPIELISADAMQLTEESRYDVIVLTASLPIYQPRFERALRPGGRMFVVVGATTLQEATLVRRSGAGGYSRESLFETCIEAARTCAAAGRLRLLDMAVPELPPQEVKRRLDAGEPLQLLDVREPWECAIARLPGSLHIPLGDLRPAGVSSIPRRQLVVICKAGGRSRRAAQFLVGAGFRRASANLTGGIDAWTRDIDPDLAAY